VVLSVAESAWCSDRRLAIAHCTLSAVLLARGLDSNREHSVSCWPCAGDIIQRERERCDQYNDTEDIERDANVGRMVVVVVVVGGKRRERRTEGSSGARLLRSPSGLNSSCSYPFVLVLLPRSCRSRSSCSCAISWLPLPPPRLLLLLLSC